MKFTSKLFNAKYFILIYEQIENFISINLCGSPTLFVNNSIIVFKLTDVSL